MWLWGGVSDLLYACSIEQSILTILVAVYFSVYQFDVDVVLGQLYTIGSMCDRRSIVTTHALRELTTTEQAWGRSKLRSLLSVCFKFMSKRNRCRKMCHAARFCGNCMYACAMPPAHPLVFAC